MATETLAVNLLMNAGQYKREARQAASATGQIGNQAQMTGTATGKLDKQLGGLGATAKFAVAGVAAGAVAKFGKDSVQAFLGFDDAMNQSIAIMGDVEDALRGDMEKAAREVGKTMRVSAEEAAEAYFFLASAGLDAEQSMAALPQVAQFAQAGMFDMATATDLATDAQSALGLAVEDPTRNLVNLTRVTDVFTKANTLANTSIQQIAEAMTTRAGAALRALNKDVEEGAAVLAALADQGIKGAQAGTQLGIVLRDLQTRALENKDAFEEAGIAVFNAEGNMRNIADIIGDLEGRFDGMSDAQKRSELAALGFADRSIAVLTTLLGTSDAIREYERELRRAGGTTEEVADKQMESFQGQLDLLKGAVKDLQISLGEMITPLLLERAETLLNTVDAIKGVFDAMGRIELPPILQGVLDVGGDLWDFLTRGAIPGPIGGLVDWLIDLGDEAEEAAAGFSILGGEMNQIPAAAQDAGDGMDEFADEADEAGDSADDAADSVRDLTLAFLEAANPIFAAQGALDRYQRAEANLAETRADSASTARDIAAAELEVAQAALQAEAALIALGDGSVTEGISAIAAALEISDQEARDLLETLGILDGTEVTSVVNTEFRTIGRPPSSSIGAQDSISFRQHGGPVRAGDPYIVGEAGPELFIPQQSGMVVANSQTSSGVAPVGQSGQTFVFYGDVYGDEGFRQRVREANVQNGRLGLN